MNKYNKFNKCYKYFEKEVNKYYLPEMMHTIGKIDLELLESRTEESLLYIFPLSERLVIEILKYKQDADIEFYNQGRYRTLNAILESKENSKYFDNRLIILIKQYYNENGLRNKLLHYRGENIIETTNMDFLITKYICVKLLKMYNKTLQELEKVTLDKIELL